MYTQYQQHTGHQQGQFGHHQHQPYQQQHQQQPYQQQQQQPYGHQQHQQYEQQQQQQQQNGMQWNGREWVPQQQQQPSQYQSGYGGYGTNSTYSSATTNPTIQYSGMAVVTTTAPAVTIPQPPQPPADVARLINTYTQYYHQWKAAEQAAEQKAQFATGFAKKEAERDAQWAKYYADQSSRAAHHYHNDPTGTPPQLPPAPPNSESHQGVQQGTTQAVATTTTTTTVSNSSLSHVKTLAAVTPTKKQSPGGMKRYVHRCLSQCTGKEQKDRMQKEVEKVIAKAVTTNSVHTTRWDQKELIPLSKVSAGLGGDDTGNSVGTVSTAASTVTMFSATQSSPYTERPVKSFGRDGMNSNFGYSGSNNNHNNKISGTGAVQPLTWSNGSPYQAMKIKNKSAATNKHKAPRGFGNSSSSISSGSDGEDSKYSYYGNHNNNNNKGNSTNSGWGDDDDFVAVPSVPSWQTNKKKNKYNSKTNSSNNKYSNSKSQSGKRKCREGFDGSNEKLNKRANRFSGAGGIADAATSSTTVEGGIKKYMGMGLIGGMHKGGKKLDETDFERMTVKGTCETLEKGYLRLTSPPKAELVRPPRVLRQHLQNLRNEWWSPSGKKRQHDYEWFCSQFKAIRQDLTVQRVADAFAVQVYETHARVALEERDLNEYNQCQTQLKELYQQLGSDGDALKNQLEFVAYRIIYYVFLTGNKKYEEGSSDLLEILLSLTPTQRRSESVAHALQIRESVADCDYHRFFCLYRSSPTNSAVRLMNYIVPNVRQLALRRICKAYRPSVPADFVLRELGFDADLEKEGLEWMESCGCVFSDDKKDLKTKDCVLRESTRKVQNSLI